MAALVTGASGHIGANLVRALLARGEKVRVLVHNDIAALSGLDVEIASGSVCDRASLESACENMDIVYHLAARISITQQDRAELETINIGGTNNVVDACLSKGVKRLIHFSSIHALTQKPMDVPVDENRPLASPPEAAPYDCSKAEGERAVRAGIERGLDAVILNPTAVLGPCDFKPSYFGSFLLMLAGRKLPALVAGGFDWVDARDVAEAAITAAERAAPGSKYLLSGHWKSVKEVAQSVKDVSGVTVPGFVCPNWLARIGLPFINLYQCRNGGAPLYTSFTLRTLCSNRNISNARANRDLSYTPRPFEETLRDTLDWFRDNGYLDTSSVSQGRTS